MLTGESEDVNKDCELVIEMEEIKSKDKVLYKTQFLQNKRIWFLEEH